MFVVAAKQSYIIKCSRVTFFFLYSILFFKKLWQKNHISSGIRAGQQMASQILPCRSFTRTRQVQDGHESPSPLPRSLCVIAHGFGTIGLKFVSHTGLVSAQGRVVIPESSGPSS